MTTLADFTLTLEAAPTPGRYLVTVASADRSLIHSVEVDDSLAHLAGGMNNIARALMISHDKDMRRSRADNVVKAEAKLSVDEIEALKQHYGVR